MKVFITGASGYIGRCVTEKLISQGHQVTGLARSERSAQILKDLGADVVLGDTSELEKVSKAASESDGTIHLAFCHDDWSQFYKSLTDNDAVIEAIGQGLKGSNKPFVVTSGVFSLPVSKEVFDEDVDAPRELRGISEYYAKEVLSKQGVKSMVVRLSPTVHSVGNEHGFMPSIIGSSKKNGVSVYVGDGDQHWPSCHRDDAADLFILALTKGKAGGVYHGVGEEGVKIKDFAKVMAEKLGIPLERRPKEEIQNYVGFFGLFYDRDCVVSSEKTKKELGWEPKGLGLLEDLKLNYF